MSTAADVVGVVWGWARRPIGVLVLWMCAMLLLGVQNGSGRVRWRTRLPGAVLAVVGWAGATGLLPAYVALAGRVSPTLGALGGGLIVLVWVYLLNLCLFLGAELNAIRSRQPAPAAAPVPPGETRPHQPETRDAGTPA